MERLYHSGSRLTPRNSACPCTWPCLPRTRPPPVRQNTCVSATSALKLGEHSLALVRLYVNFRQNIYIHENMKLGKN